MKKLIKKLCFLAFHDCCWGTFGDHWDGCPNYTGKRNTKRLADIDLEKVRPEDRYLYAQEITKE